MFRTLMDGCQNLTASHAVGEVHAVWASNQNLGVNLPAKHQQPPRGYATPYGNRSISFWNVELDMAS